MKPIGIVMVVCGLAVAAVSAQGPMREGRWEVTTQMQMPGMSMPASKNVQCVTREQLADPAKSVPSSTPGCTVSDYKASGNKVTWKSACKDMTGTGELVFNGDTYEGTMNVTSPHAMTMKLSGKRLGDCTP